MQKIENKSCKKGCDILNAYIKKLQQPYNIMIAVYLLFIVLAFLHDSPKEILDGFFKIFTSRSVLITDYMAVGGFGACLLNAAIVGLFSLLFVKRMDITPNGSTIMAMWLTTGFAMMGKNLYNMFPILFGVYLYSKFKKEEFKNFVLVTLLSATLSPIVSGFTFHSHLNITFGVVIGIIMGVFAGFIFPAVTQFTVRVHSGYCLYNLGFAGGLISTFVVSAMESLGLPMEREMLWSRDFNTEGYILMFSISIYLMFLGLYRDGKLQLIDYGKITKHVGKLVTDFYILYGSKIYFNMGLMGFVSTGLMYIVGADMNGASICGILTIIGFSAFGKHFFNSLPVMIGAIICTYINMWDPTTPMNTMAIQFSTCLAPISGQFGAVAGVLTGYLHVNTITHIGFLNSGMNLYNNGYAGGFVAMILVPVFQAFLERNE